MLQVVMPELEAWEVEHQVWHKERLLKQRLLREYPQPVGHPALCLSERQLSFVPHTG